jgi:diguanylate cyclase (GGDEF)-like protein
MAQLVDGIADLLALRDRHALDRALTALVFSQVAQSLQSVAIYQRVGDAGDERWLTSAQSTAQTPDTQASAKWTAPENLPSLNEFPDRCQALAATAPVQTYRPDTAGSADSRGHLTLFPMPEQYIVPSVMEIYSAQPLPADSLILVTSLLRVYRNFRSLLDYGERDTLTDLLNRKTFEGAFMKALTEKRDLEIEPPHERRTSSAVGSNWLGMLDIDHFKRVNDTFGHLIGDEVLLLMARLMRANFRFHDELYRFGGEEFVVLLRHVNAGDAAHVFERLRERTEGFAFPQVGKITVSVGYTALRAEDTPDIAFSRADKAVYFGKAHGRNQVCQYEELIAQGKLVETDANIGDVELF